MYSFCASSLVILPVTIIETVLVATQLLVNVAKPAIPNSAIRLIIASIFWLIKQGHHLVALVILYPLTFKADESPPGQDHELVIL
ncbi:MAG: hypothetical protein GY787_20480 [Alteromonadales bacterium]|nr:hypothetical protein [Alteromonadales bacterium]